MQCFQNMFTKGKSADNRTITTLVNYIRFLRLTKFEIKDTESIYLKLNDNYPYLKDIVFSFYSVLRIRRLSGRLLPYHFKTNGSVLDYRWLGTLLHFRGLVWIFATITKTRGWLHLRSHPRPPCSPQRAPILRGIVSARLYSFLVATVRY